MTWHPSALTSVLLLLLALVAAASATQDSNNNENSDNGKLNPSTSTSAAASAAAAAAARVPDIAMWAVSALQSDGVDARLSLISGRPVLVSGDRIEVSSGSQKNRKSSRSRKNKKNDEMRRPTLSIPLSAAITEAGALSDPVLGPILAAHPDTFVGTTILATFLVYETIKGPESQWYPYLWALLQEFHAAQTSNATLAPPLLWDPEGADRRLLEGSWILERTLEDEGGIVSDYGRVTEVLSSDHATLFDPEQFSLELYLWAWSTIWRRGVWFDEVRQALVPGLDFCGLVPAESDASKVQNEITFARGRFVLTLNKPVDSNGVIECAAQNNRAANDFFRLHGFFLPGDAPDRETVGFLRGAHITEEDPHFAIKAALIDQNDLYTHPYPYSDVPSGLFVRREGIPEHVIAYFRLRHWTPTRAQTETFNSVKRVPKVNFRKQVNSANEEKAVQDLVNTIERTVDAYPDAYETDKALLEGGTLTPRARAAVRARYEEKLVLNAARQTLIRPAQQAHEEAAQKLERSASTKTGGSRRSSEDDASKWFEEDEDDTYWDESEY